MRVESRILAHKDDDFGTEEQSHLARASACRAINTVIVTVAIAIFAWLHVGVV